MSPDRPERTEKAADSHEKQATCQQESYSSIFSTAAPINLTCALHGTPAAASSGPPRPGLLSCTTAEAIDLGSDNTDRKRAKPTPTRLRLAFGCRMRRPRGRFIAPARTNGRQSRSSQRTGRTGFHTVASQKYAICTLIFCRAGKQNNPFVRSASQRKI